MSLWNMPDGCMDASDIDYYNRINPPRQCEGCKQEEQDCECTANCQFCESNPCICDETPEVEDERT